MSPLMQYIEQIYPLSYVIRYSNVPRIKDESVAEHSFYVAAIVQKLYDAYEFDIGKALNMAISHDVIEVYINDIPHLIKERHPDLAELLKEIEEREAGNFPSIVEKGLRDMEANTIERTIVKLADAIQCEQYAQNEVKLGNSGYMLKVIKTSRLRAKKLTAQIEFKKRKFV